MVFSSKILSQTIVQLCLLKGVAHIVISPGSRNAPLIIGFTGNPIFKTFSIVDERAAAFFALGLAQQLKKPVAIVCTSGSALLNYYPAIAEAYYSDIPLIVISADRPDNLIEIGDGQTIKQENVFSNHIVCSANCKEGNENSTFNETEINKALNMAIAEQGPVHINVPFSEPLYETSPSLEVNPLAALRPEINESLDIDWSTFRSQWKKANRKMILVGVLPPNSIDESILEELSQDESVIVLTETTSNLHHNNFIPAIDQLIAPLTENEFTTLRPEILLSFGGMVISKKIKAFLRNYPPISHWHVDSKKAYDTYFVLNQHFKCTPNYFLRHFFSEKNPNITSNFQNKWLTVKHHRLQMHDKYKTEIPFCDFAAFAQIFENIPKSYQLQLSNSATVRYAQLFTLDSSLKVFCNRGTSGIDGSISTAIGAAVASKYPTLAISGDLSFLYDSNALWNNYIPNDFRIIVINNGGGGIFRILPGAKSINQFDTFFETKHSLTAKQLCEMHGISYNSASNLSDLKTEIQVFFEPSKIPKLLEIFTPSEINDKVLIDYFKFIK